MADTIIKEGALRSKGWSPGGGGGEGSGSGTYTERETFIELWMQNSKNFELKSRRYIEKFVIDIFSP